MPVSTEQRNIVAADDTTLDFEKSEPASTHQQLSPAKLTHRERQKQNFGIALQNAKAGIPSFPSTDDDEKRPLVKAWPQLDTTIEKAKKTNLKQEAFEENGFDPLHVGCTTKTHVIKQLWSKVPNSVCSISCGPAGIVVVDADNKKTIDGPALVLAHLEANGVDLRQVPHVRTQSGALHLYFANPEKVPSGKIKAFDTDIKGVGGQVIAPGTVRGDGKTYVYEPGFPTLIEALTAGTLPPIPACIVEMMGTKSPSTKDRDPEIQAALEELQHGAPDVLAPVFNFAALKAKDGEFAKIVEDPSPDHSENRFTVAKCLHREFGREAFTIHHLAAFYDDYIGAGSFTESRPRQGEYDNRSIAREFVKSQGSRPISDGSEFGAVETVEEAIVEVEAAVCIGMGEPEAIEALGVALRNDDADQATTTKALEYARRFHEGDDAAGDRLRALFGIAPVGQHVETAKPAKNGRNIRRAADRMAPLAPVEYLVNELMMRGDIIVADGAPGIGKSVLLLHLSICIATGRPFLGRETEQGAALYFGPENPDEENRRFQANLKHHGLSANIPHYFDSDTFKLLGPKNDVKAIIEAARAVQAETGQACKLIVLDNARRALCGLSEKDDENVIPLMLACETIRNATGAAIILIHHTLRDGSRSSGSGGFESHSDSCWHFDEDKGGPVIKFPKLRAGNKKQTLRFETTTESVTVDKAGKPVNTVVAVDAGSLAGVNLKVDDEPAKPAEPSRDDKLLEAARSLTLKAGSFRLKELRFEIGNTVAERSMRRIVSRLVKLRILEVVGEVSSGVYRSVDPSDFEAAGD